MDVLRRRISQFVFTFLVLFLLLPFSQALGGEEELFTSSAPPDALILVDWSGSMHFNPRGDSRVWGKDPSCADTPGNLNANPSGSHIHKCTRAEIAKRALFALLDADGNGTINAADETALGVRLGYMKFYGTFTTDPVLMDESITIPYPIGSSYSNIYCGENSCTINTNAHQFTPGPNAEVTPQTFDSPYLSGQGAFGGTPLNRSLERAKIYLDAHRAADPARDCRQRYVILVSDGQDSFGCAEKGGIMGNECDNTAQYRLRRDSVRQAKILADAGYQIFAIGLGDDMPNDLIYSLNWMAYYGGTENPNAVKGGVDPRGPQAFNPGMYTEANVCDRDTPYNMTDNYFSRAAAVAAGVSEYGNSSCEEYWDDPALGRGRTAGFAINNDPGVTPLTGYAFMATDPNQLRDALRTIMQLIQQGSYSFTKPSVQTIRTEDENYLYKASFQPAADPFWKGHLKQYEYKADGTLRTTENYDTGDRFPASRTIKTYLGGAAGALVDFTSSNITPALLNITGSGNPANTQRDNVINYIRGVNNPDGWMLGDISRSGPVTIGTPNVYYRDPWDTNNSFATFRNNNERSSANGRRIVVVGTNAGQIHGFRTSTGTELWSFIPPNLLPKLKNLAHTTHPSNLPHQYLVDGPIKGTDAWLGSGNGRAKNAHDWKTLLIFGEGRGASGTMWSSSSSCSTGFSSTYSTATPYYCGYHALDVTNTTSPSYMWNLDFRNAASSAPYMGDPWNEMQVGRVRTGITGTETERWVGFIGGGYSPLTYSAGNSESWRGKAFYIVDLKNGDILWSYTHGSGSSNTNSSMTHSIPAPATLVDTDGDSFIDTAYVGDMWGNMWRFTFCRASSMASGCSTSGWSGSLFLRNNTTNATPIYTAPTVALDSARKPWVFWGTGNKNNPTATNTQDYFYGVQDVDRTGPALNATSYSDTPSDSGWRIALDPREKVLSGSIVFNKVLYFATYIPPSDAERTATNLCGISGKARLYAVHFLTGVGIFADQKRWIDIGDGIPSDVGVTLTEDGNVLVGSIVVDTSHKDGPPSGDGGGVPPASIKNMIYWKDRKIE